MSDRTFEWGAMGLSVAVLVWIISGIIFRLLGIPWVIITGLVIWLAGNGTLLYYWGRNYMSRM
jgi:hypothetical protein